MPYDKTITEQIRDLTELPESVHFDSGRTWQRIEQMLQDKQQSKYGWLEYAAIVLIVAISALTYLLNGNEGRKSMVVARHTPTPSVEKPVLHQAPGVIPERFVLSSVQSSNKNNPIPNTKSSNERFIDTDTKLAEVTVRDDMAPAITSEVTMPKQSVVELTPVAVTPIPPKKKLRIVHLNELYRPDIIEIARTESKKAEPEPEPEPGDVTPAKSIWKTKTPVRPATSLNDNQ